MTSGDRDGVSRLAHEDLRAGLIRNGFDEERADAVVHALVDIDESIENVYRTLLPELMALFDAPSEVFKEKLWDIREEFRHVDYHLRDGHLTDL